MSFSTCTQYWYPCPQNGLFPQLSHREFWMSCGDPKFLEGPAKWDEEKQDSCFIRVFWVVRSAALAEAAVLSHCIYRWERAGHREQWGNSNFAWHTNPSQMAMLKITRNSNVELHRPSEKIDDLKQFLPCSKGIFQCGSIVILKTFLTGHFLLIWREGFPQWLLQM